MRLVDLHLDADRPIHLELHGRLTVVVSDEQIGRVIADRLVRAYVLAGTEVTGTVDGGGFLTPFDPTAVVALDLVGQGVKTLTGRDLPPPDPSRRDDARRAALTEMARLQPIVDRACAALDRQTRVYDATVAGVMAAKEELVASKERIDALGAQSVALEDRPPQLERERADARAALEVARARIDELRSVHEEIVDALGPSGDASHIRLGDDTELLVDLIDRAAAVGGVGGAEHEELTGWLRAVADGSAPLHPTAESLLRESADIEAVWDRVAAAGVEGDPDVLAATRRHAELVQQHDLLEGLARSGVLGETARSEIESAHVAVIACSGRGDRGGERDRCLAREEVALTRYGFDSYLDFTIATSTRSVGRKAEAKLALVAQEVKAADEELVMARQTAAEGLQRLAEQREPMRERITEFLGFRPDGSSAAPLAVIPAVPPLVVRLDDGLAEAIEHAQEEVRRYGETVGDLDAERGSLEERRDELVRQRRQVEGRMEQIRSVLSSAEFAVESAADRMERCAAVARSVEAELAVVGRTCDELVDASEFDYTDQDVPAIIDALLTRLDPWSPAPHPVVLHETLAALGADGAIRVLTALAAGADRVQLIYLTEDPILRDWAEGLDPATGACVVLSRPRWSRRLGRRIAGRTNR